MPPSERLSLVFRVDMVKHRLVARSRRKEQSRPWHKPQPSGSLGFVTPYNCRRGAAIVNPVRQGLTVF
jgi:hypothetical protein